MQANDNIKKIASPLSQVSMVVDGKTLEVVTAYKYLGVWITRPVILIGQNRLKKIAKEPIKKSACYIDAFMSTVPLTP